MHNQPILSENPNRASNTLKQGARTLRDWRSYLSAKRKFLGVLVGIGIIIGTAIWIFRPPKYEAFTTFVVEGGESGGFGLGQFMEIAAVLGMGGSMGDKGLFETDNITELYKSRRLLTEALMSPFSPEDSAYLLIDHFVVTQGLSKRLLKKAPITAIREQQEFRVRDWESNKAEHPGLYQRYKDSVINVLVTKLQKKHLKIGKPDRKLDILRVDITSTDEAFSKRFNEELVAKVNQFYIRTRTQKSAEHVAILEHKVDSVRRLLDQSIHKTVAITDATPNLNPTRQVQRMVPVQQAQFDMEINVTVLEELVKNLELAKLSLDKEVPLIEIIDAPIYPLKRDDEGYFLLPLIGGLLAFFLGCVFLLMRRTVLQAINE